MAGEPGATPIGRIQIGDNGAKTWTMNSTTCAWTSRRVRNHRTRHAPHNPGKPTGSSPTRGTINYPGRAVHDSPPITYRIYRGDNTAALGRNNASAHRS